MNIIKVLKILIPLIHCSYSLDTLKLSVQNSYLTEKSGANLTLHCNSNYEPILCLWKTSYSHVYTLNNGVFAERGRLEHVPWKGCAVKILGVQERDSGKWECEVGVVIGDDFVTAKEQITLAIRGKNDKSAPVERSVSSENRRKPSTTSGIREVGDDVIMHCSGTSGVVSLCRWKTPYHSTYIVGQGIYVERGRIQWRGKDPNRDCSIRISSLEMRDSGVWTCEIGFSGKASKDIIIQTKDFKINIEAPLKLSTPTILTENNQATLVCHANKEFDNCKWKTPYGSTFTFKDPQSSHEEGRISFYSFSSSKTDCGLMISRIEPKDNGEWICLVETNNNGKIHQNSSEILSLQSKSSIQLDDGSGDYGSEIDYGLPPIEIDAFDYVNGDFDKVSVIGGSTSFRPEVSSTQRTTPRITKPTKRKISTTVTSKLKAEGSAMVIDRTPKKQRNYESSTLNHHPLVLDTNFGLKTRKNPLSTTSPRIQTTTTTTSSPDSTIPYPFRTTSVIKSISSVYTPDKGRILVSISFKPAEETTIRRVESVENKEDGKRKAIQLERQRQRRLDKEKELQRRREEAEVRARKEQELEEQRKKESLRKQLEEQEERERRRKEEVAKRVKEEEENNRLRIFLEEQRLKELQQEEELRRKKEEEAQRLQKIKEETERLQRVKEEADRLQRIKEEAERLQRIKEEKALKAREEEQRLQKAKDEELQRKKAEERLLQRRKEQEQQLQRRRKEQEEEFKKQKELELQRRRLQQIEELKKQKQRERDAAELLRKEAEEEILRRKQLREQELLLNRQREREEEIKRRKEIELKRKLEEEEKDQRLRKEEEKQRIIEEQDLRLRKEEHEREKIIREHERRKKLDRKRLVNTERRQYIEDQQNEHRQFEVNRRRKLRRERYKLLKAERRIQVEEGRTPGLIKTGAPLSLNAPQFVGRKRVLILNKDKQFGDSVNTRRYPISDNSRRRQKIINLNEEKEPIQQIIKSVQMSTSVKSTVREEVRRVGEVRHVSKIITVSPHHTVSTSLSSSQGNSEKQTIQDLLTPLANSKSIKDLIQQKIIDKKITTLIPFIQVPIKLPNTEKDETKRECIISQPSNGNISCSGASFIVSESRVRVPPDEQCRLSCSSGYVPLEKDSGQCYHGRLSQRLECVKPDALLILGGRSDTYGVLNSVELITAQGVCRGAVPPLPQMRWKLFASSIGADKVLACGGKGQFGDSQGNCWLMEFRPEPTWKETQPMRLPRDSAAVVYEDNRVWVLGGSLGKLNGYTDVVDVFDPTSESWQGSGSVMTSPRHSHCAVGLGNGSIFVTGGYGGLSLTERYDIADKTWSVLPELNPVRAQHGCALVDLHGESGVIIVGGDSGGTRLGDVRFFSLSASVWRKVSELNTARWGRPGVGVVGGRITVAAGWSGFRDLDTVEYYDEKTSSWRLTASRLQTERRWPYSSPVSLSLFPKCVQKRSSG